ncbi:MAG: hypothetical protein M3083_17440 [Actinomycetota bacterium]|nr:hypothetical protein [Actinomycetota bacterium]
MARQAHLQPGDGVPGLSRGRDALLEEVAQAEVARVGTALVGRFDQAATLEDLLAAGRAEAPRQLRDHVALAFLLALEPETLSRRWPSIGGRNSGLFRHAVRPPT